MNSSRTINADVSAVITNLATGVTAKPDATFKPSYDTPNATYAVLRQASKTRDLDLLLTCLTPRAAAGLTGGLDGELLREIAPAVIAALGEPALGKLISDNGDTRVYEYSRNGRPVTNDTQRMVKLDGKWLLDN